MFFLDLQTRAGDVFAAELRQTGSLLLAHAASAQITQLLQADDQVFQNQAFPRAGTLTTAGWANLWDLLPEPRSGDHGHPPTGSGNSSHAPTRTTVELRPTGAASPASARLFLSA